MNEKTAIYASTEHVLTTNQGYQIICFYCSCMQWRLLNQNLIRPNLTAIEKHNGHLIEKTGLATEHPDHQLMVKFAKN